MARVDWRQIGKDFSNKNEDDEMGSCQFKIPSDFPMRAKRAFPLSWR